MSMGQMPQQLCFQLPQMTTYGNAQPIQIVHFVPVPVQMQI